MWNVWSLRGCSCATASDGRIGVERDTSSGPPAFAQAASVDSCAGLRTRRCASGTPLSDAGHGGMYFVSVTVRMPSATAAASPAVSRRQCSEPTSPLLWHDAQLPSRIGRTAEANDGPPLASLACGPVMLVGIA